MIPARRTLLSLLSLGSLSACGFSLRGSQLSSRLPFSSLYLQVTPHSLLERELRGAVLGQDGVVLAKDPKSAEVVLRILSEAQEKKVMTLNAQGQVREFSLLYRLKFDAKGKNDKILIPSSELALQAFMSFSESQAPAKETEEKMIYGDLRNDAINQLMRRLAQVKIDE